MIEQINYHVDQALARLLEQYKSKPRIKSVISSICTPIQGIQTVTNELNTLRTINGSVGQQLDNLGTIVGIQRGELTDAQYRLWIKAKVLINISDGEPEIVIQAYTLLTEGSTTYLTEFFPGAIGLMSDGVIPSGLESTVAHLIKQCLSAGVRIDTLGYFSPINPFSFDGIIAPLGGGYGSIYDANIGGEFAGLYKIT